MQAECFPISMLPGTSALFRDFAEITEGPAVARLRRWYPQDPFRMDWAHTAPALKPEHSSRLADALLAQAAGINSGSAALANIERLRSGAAAVVTGQQVGLFGGPLLTLLKAATAIRKAQDATRISGREHVPVFWLATEDHDVAEVDQVHLLGKTGVESTGASLGSPGLAVPAGDLPAGAKVEPALAWAEELLAYAPICDVLREAYTDHGAYTATLAGGFGRLLSHVFADHGLIILDASTRDFHLLGKDVLQGAIEHAAEIETALISRSAELENAGYHAQVKVAPEMSLLFLLSPGESGVVERKALRRTKDGGWKAGVQSYATAELLSILEDEPERLSPNALLRPVFQDAILPTAAYIGGPAEIAYFAQSAVLYERLLGRVTPVLPRLSATLVELSVEKVMAQYEVQFLQVLAAKTTDELSTRLGARAMPIEGKRKLAAAGNALDVELGSLLEYMNAMSPDLGRAAGVSANKMRYQMNRLRRMAARFQLERETSLRKQANTLMLNLFPNEHLQERLVAGIWFLARSGDSLPDLLVEHAGQECPGHRVLFL
ncbi:MAG: bacillithiol biosynthesis cysteine-adding enzyme BshC [Janthinobacterium lividum]